MEHSAIRSALKAADNKLFVVFFLLTYFRTFPACFKTNGNCRKQKEREREGKKRAEKLTFSLNGGGMGRRDAAVTMQGRLGLLLLSLSLTPRPAKTRFMTSRIPSYFSSWCTLWVVYLGLRALSPSLWGFYDLQWQHMQQEVTKRTTLLSVCSASFELASWHVSPTNIKIRMQIFPL